MIFHLCSGVSVALLVYICNSQFWMPLTPFEAIWRKYSMLTIAFLDKKPMASKPLSTSASLAYSNGRIKVASIVFPIIILMFIRCITFSLKPSVRPLVLGIHIIDSAKQILRCSLHRSHQYSSRHFSKISHEKSVMFWMLHNGAKIFMKLQFNFH